MNECVGIVVTWTIILFLLTSCASRDFKDEFESEKNWLEQISQLPDYPDEKNLIEFDAGSITDYRHSIDRKSIEIGQDGVIRFTLVTRSPAGAMNVSYEGIRCDTHERKLYAIGRADRTWSLPNQSRWQPLDFIRQFYAQRELAQNMFCPHKQIVNSRQEAIRALKEGMHPDIFN